MSSQGVSTQAVVMSYNTTTGAYVVGDTANITVKFIKDGTITTPTNSLTEPSGAGVKGAYVLALTSAETQCQTLWIGGNSSSANTIIVPITLTFTSTAQLGVNVTQWQGASPNVLVNGLVATSASGGSISSVSGTVASITSGVNVTQWLGSPPNALVSGLVPTSTSGGSISTVSGSVGSVVAGVNVTQIAGVATATSLAQIGVNIVTWEGDSPNRLVSGLVAASASGGSISSVSGSVGSVTSGVTVTTNNDKTGYSLAAGEETAISNAVWDNASGIETNVTPRQALRYIAAAEIGVTTGALTNTFTISAISASGTTRITATTDSSGNRSAIVLS